LGCFHSDGAYKRYEKLLLAEEEDSKSGSRDITVIQGIIPLSRGIMK
jgi:hypothetical protein